MRPNSLFEPPASSAISTEGAGGGSMELEELMALARTDFHDGKPDSVVIVEECDCMPDSAA